MLRRGGRLGLVSVAAGCGRCSEEGSTTVSVQGRLFFGGIAP